MSWLMEILKILYKEKHDLQFLRQILDRFNWLIWQHQRIIYKTWSDIYIYVSMNIFYKLFPVLPFFLEVL